MSYFRLDFGFLGGKDEVHYVGDLQVHLGVVGELGQQVLKLNKNQLAQESLVFYVEVDELLEVELEGEVDDLEQLVLEHAEGAFEDHAAERGQEVREHVQYLFVEGAVLAREEEDVVEDLG